MAEIDARVDHRDAHRRERRRRLPGVVRAVCDAYHWRCASGSVGANASRRTRARSTQATPATRRSAAGCRLDRERAQRREARRRARRSPARRAAPTAAGSAPGSRPTWYRAPRPVAGSDERGAARERPDEGASSHALTRTVSGGPGESAGGQPEHGRRVEAQLDGERPVRCRARAARTLTHAPRRRAARGRRPSTSRARPVRRRPRSRGRPPRGRRGAGRRDGTPSTSTRAGRGRRSGARRTPRRVVVRRSPPGGRARPGRTRRPSTAPPSPKRFASCAPVRSCDGQRWFGDDLVPRGRRPRRDTGGPCRTCRAS